MITSVIGENVALLQQAKLVAVRSRSIHFIGRHSITLAQIQIAAIDSNMNRTPHPE
jgi:hypothetical protein